MAQSLFHDSELKKVSFKVDNIKYEFDNQQMNWTTDIQEEEQNTDDIVQQEALKKKAQKQEEVRKQVLDNEFQIKKLGEEIEIMKDNLTKYTDKLTHSQQEQQLLIDEYIHEHLETEKVKNAREKLEKLKRELNL